MSCQRAFSWHDTGDKMIRLLKKIFLCFCTWLLLSCSQQGSVLHDTNGNPISVSQLHGKWIIINYWATWCDSCVQEISELNHFYQHNQDKNIVLYGVNYDHMPMKDLQAAIARTHIAYPVVLEDPAKTWALGEFDALPVTFIIGPNGEVVKKFLGKSTEKSLLATIRELQKNYS